MGNVLKKMRYQVPYRFFWLHILLPADMAVPAMHLCITVKAVAGTPFF